MGKPTPITGQPFSADDPLFTVIVADYERSVPREHFRRKMACLAEQSCEDFEVLVYHDGPKAQSYAEDLQGGPMHPATRFFTTPTHAGDWGHSARDLGIRAARGQWIIHTNADNVFYPSLIAALKDVATDPDAWVFAHPPQRYPIGLRPFVMWLDRRWKTGLLEPQLFKSSEPQILVYGIVMRGMISMKGYQTRYPPAAARQGIILSGIPVKRGMVDAMQLVMRRDLWLAEGGWHDQSMNSDGVLYERFARKYRVLAVPAILGEHW